MSWTIIFSYLTFEIMSFGMKNRKKWPHGEEILKLRAFLCHSLEVRPVLACHIHCKKFNWLTGHLLLEVQGVGKNLPPEHIEGTKENPMTTYSEFQALLVCFSWGLLRRFTRRWPLPSTDTSSRDLKHGRCLTVQTCSNKVLCRTWCFIGKYREVVQVYMTGWGMDIVHESCDIIIICDEHAIKDGFFLRSK